MQELTNLEKQILDLMIKESKKEVPEYQNNIAPIYISDKIDAKNFWLSVKKLQEKGYIYGVIGINNWEYANLSKLQVLVN